MIINEKNLEIQPNSEQKSLDSMGDDSCQYDDSFMSLDTNDTTYVPTENEDSYTGSTSSAVRPARERRKPDWYGFSNMCTKSNNVKFSELSLEEALQGPEKEHWLRAVQEELQSFDDNSAWELADVPKGGPIVKCKWVLRSCV